MALGGSKKKKEQKTKHRASVYQALLEMRQAWGSPTTGELETVLTCRVILGNRVQGRHQTAEEDCVVGWGTNEEGALTKGSGEMKTAWAVMTRLRTKETKPEKGVGKTGRQQCRRSAVARAWRTPSVDRSPV